MNVAQHLVQRLVDEDVEVVFTVPGEQLDAVFGAFAGTGIKVIPTRHEQGAAFMAYGYARSTGRLGVYLVLSGPGVLNSLTGLATAYAGDARVLCIAGQIATSLLGRNLGIPHEIPDQIGVLQTLTGWARRIEKPNSITAVLDEAFHRLHHRRPRPIAIEVSTDILAAEVEEPEAWQPPAAPASPDRQLVQAAADLLAAAQAPLIFVGSGARGAVSQISELSDRLQAPVTTELGGRGIVSDESELAISLPVAHRLWPQADVILAVGTRLLRPQVEWGVAGLRIIRIDLDEEEIHRVTEPEVALVGDAAELTAALLDGLPSAADRQEWLAEVARTKRAVTAEISQLSPQIEYLDVLRAALPDDGFFVDEMTQVGYAARLAFPVRHPSTYVLPTYVGALGFGYATALGVKVAHPERAVLSISGDGGFLFTASELATAVQHRIGVVAVVFNDSSYSNVKRSQLKFLQRTIATELHNPDFVLLAEAYGAMGMRADGPAALQACIEEAFAHSDRPTVIEVPVGDMANPWPWIRLPRVR